MIDLDIKNLKKIKNGWYGVIAVCIFLSLFMLSGVYIIVMGAVKQADFTYLNTAFISLCVLFSLTIYGSLKSKNWGRVLGIITSIMLLFVFPIGTLFGLIGLISFAKAKPIFISDSITYADIKHAYQQELAG